MGLDNYFYTKKFNNVDTEDYVYDDDEYTLELFLYVGEPLPNKALDTGLRQVGTFRGKLFSDLFDVLIEGGGVGYSLYSEDYLQKGDLEDIASIMSWTKRQLLNEDGELWWNSYLEDHLSDSEFKDCYDYETTLSFILMFEWYSQQENVVMSSCW